MKSTYIDYKDTQSFSQLLISYLEDDTVLRTFYGNRPTLEGFEKQLGNKPAFEHRELLSNVLEEQYGDLLFENDSKVKANIHKLRDKETYTVTTGHQLNIFTGPLYFVFKIITAIKLAQDLKKQFPDKDFVPVYWMATEDHDFDEINHTYLFGKKVQWDLVAQGATGRLSTEGIEKAVKEYCSMFGLSPESKELESRVSQAYLGSYTLADATRHFVHSLFAEYGLVILDADHQQLKKIFLPYISRDIFEQISFQQSSSASQSLEALGYKAQVHPREQNFFYLKEGLRERLIMNEGRYQLVNGENSWDKIDLEREIEEHPYRFSPNVIMRPLYQEVILPNIAYIGGGAEVAYWMQLKSTFDKHGVDFPILIPRNSAMLMDNKLVSKIFRLDFTFKSIFKPTEVLKEEYVRRHTKHKLNLKDEWMELNAIFSKIKLRAHKIDPTLGPSTEAVQARLKKAINNLEKKLLKADKKNFEDALIQIDRVKEKLFPGGHLQERHENFAFYYLKYGDSLFDELIKNFKPLEFKFSILY